MTETMFTDDQATLGDRIAAAREAAGLTQAELAQRLGVRRPTLRDWEDDRAEPRANRLQMLAGCLGVSLRWLMTGEGEDPPLASGTAAALPASVAAQLVNEVRALRAQLLATCEGLERLERRLRSSASEAQDD